MVNIRFWCVIVIVTAVKTTIQAQFDPDSIIFPDEDNKLGSSCIRQSDGHLGICTEYKNCRGVQINSVIDYCKFNDQTICCSLRNLYNSIDTRLRTVHPVPSSERTYSTHALIGEMYEDERRIKWKCGGSLIAPHFVLTSGHCVYTVNIPTYIRVSRNTTERQMIKYSDVLVDNVFVHPDYNPWKLYNDLAIIRLKRSVTWIRTAILSTVAIDFTSETIYISEWINRPDDTEEFNYYSEDLTIVSNDVCYANNPVPELTKGLLSNQICISRKAGSALNPCTQGFYGPLETGRGVIVGMPSFAFGCEEQQPVVFTNLVTFIPWIKAIINYL
ncbi:hypothetical protein DMENIID0001_016700 [Sergentomyia squamirostris]